MSPEQAQVRFEVYTTVKIQVEVFLAVMSCSDVVRYQNTGILLQHYIEDLDLNRHVSHSHESMPME
jgi:hypothetical protein